MRLGHIGYGVGNGVEEIAFDSHRAFLDFDLIIISGSQVELAKGPYQRRRSEFRHFLAKGRTIIYLLGDMQHPGLIVPIQENIQLVISHGNRIDFAGPPMFQALWKGFEDAFEYEGYLAQSVGTPLCFVHDTKLAVGAWVRTNENGNMILLPAFSSRTSGRREFFEQAALFVEQLNLSKGSEPLPAWAKAYQTKRQKELDTKLEQLELKAKKISDQVGKTRALLEGEEDLKVLFTSKGDTLVNAVASAFAHLGVTAVKGPPGEDDLKFDFNNQPFVIEVKGKKKSAGEEDAAQLEKWVSNHLLSFSKKAKGLLIVNAFCEAPLAERTQPAFPSQMQKFSIAREHCLITTTQLLNMVLSVRAGTSSGKQVMNDLSNCIGVFKGFEDWKLHFSEHSAPTSVS